MTLDLKELIKVVRPILSDAQALNILEVYPHWDTVIGKALTQEDINNGFDRYQYQGKLYRLIQSHTPQVDWTPDTTPALWAEVSLEEWPLWRQPQGAHDAYMTGDQVTWQEKRWVSSIDSNVWEPGVSGWTEYVETQPEEIPQETEGGQTDGNTED